MKTYTEPTIPLDEAFNLARRGDLRPISKWIRFMELEAQDRSLSDRCRTTAREFLRVLRPWAARKAA